MNPKLEKLLVDWKCAGCINSLREWEALERYFEEEKCRRERLLRCVSKKKLLKEFYG